MDRQPGEASVENEYRLYIYIMAVPDANMGKEKKKKHRMRDTQQAEGDHNHRE